MTIDKSTLYVHAWEDSGLEIGNYLKFTYLFEDALHAKTWALDHLRFRRITDMDAVAAYRAAEAEFTRAAAALWESSVPVTEIPTLPPIPAGHRWCCEDDWLQDGDVAKCSIEPGCNHWHAHVCDCDGQCSCHWNRV